MDLAVAAGLTALLLLAVVNIFLNMSAAGIAPGYGFLVQEAGFDVSESLIPYQPDDTYGRVILTGLVNTIFLAGVCLVLSTAIGVAVGLTSVGPSPLGRVLALGYVELFRNLPKLLVLLVLYVVAVNGLPHVRQAVSLGPVFLSNRSVNFPVPELDATALIPMAVLCAGLLFCVLRSRSRWRKGIVADWKERCLQFAVVLGLPVLCIPVFAVHVGVSVPELKGFDFKGGGRISLQFAIIALTLGLYHGAQIAEVVRGGLQAIPAGQTEAARALGLKRWQVIRLVILPQVVRIVIPPMNNQYVNLIKNTSIAIAVGYSDLMSVTGTIINQTFKPFEMMLITMGLYLGLCTFLTTVLNRFHRRLTERETR
ncbi:ABC transporter permease subunit [Roseibium aggregatum]|uniref:ABC transporter permease subunit n=1 Tax=Roseibium aggregatum TaxID=187304 RepID=A0A939EJ39_9HYPH|nr:ABC transporter permease subunit [Roseibium aggregatum]MBN9672579.1 ABC transporter permease subunit [Roseibium aggregatum]